MHSHEVAVGIDVFQKFFNGLVTEWKEEYCKNSESSPEEWPVVLTESEFINDFLVWLQCKGYTV